MAQDNVGLLKAAAAARLLGIGERKLWSLTNQGDIPHVRIGRAVRYDPADLERWIDDHRYGGANGRRRRRNAG